MRASELKAPTDPATINRFWSSSDKSADCWVWQKSLTVGGYGQFNCEGKIVRTHRLAYAIAHGYLPANILVCHSCDNRRCIKPDHLFLGDYLLNNQDMFRKGRGHVFDGTHCLGEKNVNAKLTEQKAREAVWLRSCGFSFSEIAERFEVSVQAIFPIFEGQTWKHAVGIGDNSWMTELELAEVEGWWEPYEAMNNRRGKVGEEGGNAKLTEAEVMEIIWLRSQGLTMEELAKRYGVCKSAVKAIFLGKNWQHITGRLKFHGQIGAPPSLRGSRGQHECWLKRAQPAG